MADDLLLAIALIPAAFVPPLIYVYIIRNSETYNKEPWFGLLLTFLWGATIAIIVSILLETLATSVLYHELSPLTRGFWNFEPYDVVLETIILACIVAPVVEESAKASGIRRRRLKEKEDGMVYGAAVGLGFAASENVLYLVSALAGSTETFVATAVLRAVTSTFLHASASAIVGYGISKVPRKLTPEQKALIKKITKQEPAFMKKQGMRTSWLPYLGLAILIHALFNLFASFGDLVEASELAFAFLGLVLAFGLALGAFVTIYNRIRKLDLPAGFYQ